MDGDNIYREIKIIKEYFNEIDRKINIFQKKTGLRCINNCGFCCEKEDIYTMDIEFYPLALYLIEKKENDNILTKFENEDNSLRYCIFYDEQKKRCKVYEHRGLICRLFGFSGRINKRNEREIITCRYIKEMMNNKLYEDNKSEMLIIGDCYDELISLIGYDIERKMYPINEAIWKAIMKISYITSMNDMK